MRIKARYTRHTDEWTYGRVDRRT